MRDRFRHHRPDWWPENETWPPVRPPHWRPMSRRFMRRMGCLFMLATFLASFIFVVFLTFVAKSLGIIQIPNSFWWVIPGGVVLFFFGIWLLIMTARSLQRLSAPLGDLVEAADRISAGDFSAEVPERGSGEMRSLVRAFNGMASRLKLTEEQRRDLMADITHELRTPITIIQGNVEGIIDGVYSADEVRLKSILEETQILSRLVEDLRTLALAESGALQLRKEPTDMAVLIGDTVAAFRAQADEAGMSLEMHTSANAPMLNVDPERMRQVLSNLIANALRYTQRGGSVWVKYEMVDGGEKQAQVTVEDNGVGIAPDVLPNIFNRFYKSRDSSGTGLGLPIARHLVDAHGGTITAESEVEKGTILRISLPVEDER